MTGTADTGYNEIVMYVEDGEWKAVEYINGEKIVAVGETRASCLESFAEKIKQSA